MGIHNWGMFKWQNENCQKCGLWNYSLNPKIEGKGNSVDPKIVLIGEAPGPDEAEQGKPFVGRAGKKLDNMLVKVGVHPDHIFITNIVKCFPPASTKTPTRIFRVPKETEIELCKPFFQEELEKMENLPILMTLGNVALFGLIGKNRGITKEAGVARVIQNNGKFYTLVPNYHPSFICRNSNYENEFIEVLKNVYNKIT